MTPQFAEKPMDSKFEFWNDLPNEIRTECIERMDFKTRMRLRATSKQDKSLVDSAKKYQFDSVIVNLFASYMPSVICKKSGRSEVKIECESPTPEFLQKAWQLVCQILKFSKAKTIDFASKFATDNDGKFLTDIFFSTPFHFKSVTMNCGKSGVLRFLLSNCESLESIYLEDSEHMFGDAEMTELMKVSSVINAKIVRMVNLTSPHVPYQFITKWINKKSLELGKTLQIRTLYTKIVGFLAATCEKHVVSETSQTLRLHTNDPSKHILIREIPTAAFAQEAYFSFLVIPSEQTESEYEKNDQWAHDFHAKDLAKFMGQFQHVLNDD